MTIGKARVSDHTRGWCNDVAEEFNLKAESYVIQKSNRTFRQSTTEAELVTHLIAFWQPFFRSPRLCVDTVLLAILVDAFTFYVELFDNVANNAVIRTATEKISKTILKRIPTSILIFVLSVTFKMNLVSGSGPSRSTSKMRPYPNLISQETVLILFDTWWSLALRLAVASNRQVR